MPPSRQPPSARHRRPFLLLALLAGAALAPVAGSAQELGGLPAYAPINPVITSRSGLYFQPYELPVAGPRRLRTTVSLDYASTIESSRRPGAAELLDAELLRVDAALVRDLGARTFARADVTVAGAYAGFLDGFLDWYHGLIGVRMPEREARPRDRFAYRVDLPDGVAVSRRPASLYLGDLRLGLGVRHSPHLQSIVSATLPTSTGPAGYGRGTVSLNWIGTVHAETGRLVYEGSAGVGVTPRHGALAPYQRVVMASASSGMRVRLWGRQTVFANVYYGSPAYERTTLHSLDGRELSLDFGWMMRTRSGREWKIGMTEDLEPSGPGIDLIFRVGGTF